MAQRVTVELEDDLDGGPAVETVRFGFGGSEYEIDPSAKNASALRQRIAPYLDHARKAGPGSRRRPARTPANRPASGGIRAWAKEQASSSANAGGSRPAWSRSTRRLRERHDHNTAGGPRDRIVVRLRLDRPSGRYPGLPIGEAMRLSMPMHVLACSPAWV